MTTAKPLARYSAMGARFASGFAPSSYTTSWDTTFHAHWPQAAALGFDQRFLRLWDYYLAYSEAGFAEGTIDVNLIAMERG
jgi:cyclopropane-fatty-acyl-phospholipid synthase